MHLPPFANNLLVFLVILLPACSPQTNKGITETTVNRDQLANLSGVWISSWPDRKGVDTLELQEDGNYRHRRNGSSAAGQWTIMDSQHLSLDQNNYRFFFKSKNLILENSAGDQFEYRNDKMKSGEPAYQIDGRLSQFIRRIFQDKNGDMWFGTNGDGVIRYNGDTLEYFSLDEGFGGLAVRGIAGDSKGNVWFGTERGLTVYNGTSFSNFSEKDGLIHNDVWSLLIDRNGTIWVGTLGGVCYFDGKAFTHFALPEAEPDSLRGVTSAWIVHSIMEDSKGNIWFGTNGGAYKYDGSSLTNISTADGLCHNSVNCILEDVDGNFWFATHHQGICRWDGKTFTQISEADGVKGIEAWDLYADTSGNIWFPTEGFGVYRYNGRSFSNFHHAQGLTSDAIQCTFEDNKGVLWAGGYNGLFRSDGQRFHVVRQEALGYLR